MIEIELPFPARELSPNARVHWRRKATVVADYRATAGWLAKDAIVRCSQQLPLRTPVQAIATFFVSRRQHDEDNLRAMLKPAWDGFVDARLLAGDRAHQLMVLCQVLPAGRGKEPAVHIALTELR